MLPLDISIAKPTLSLIFLAKNASSLPLGFHVFQEPPAGLGFWLSYDLYGDEDFPFYDVLA